MPRIEKLIVLRDTDGPQTGNGGNLLALMLSNEPFAGFILNCISDFAGRGTIAVPKQWNVPSVKNGLDIVHYTQKVPVHIGRFGRPGKNSWLVVSNGRFITKMDNRRIRQIMTGAQADVVAVNITEHLRASYEKILTSGQDEIVGFRLFYEDSVQPAPVSNDWPHHLFIRADALKKLTTAGGVPLAFNKFLELCRSESLVLKGIDIGGSVLDLTSQEGLLKLMQHGLESAAYCLPADSGENDIAVADSARLFGKIVFGKNISIDRNAIIVGPAIIGNDVKIGDNAVIRASMIGPGVSVKPGEIVEEHILTSLPNVQEVSSRKPNTGRTTNTNLWDSKQSNYRQWPKFSYAGAVKRILDIIVSVIVLLMFAPFIPVIMLVIKLASPGPVFFKDTRQGLHGKVFKCIKFRTMKVGASRMQDRLRVLNQADGPQFMIEDDPRLNPVGGFLRETYLDEIPQFVNVLLGEMSVVGPRPSPESENRLCPFWRDARLSVRPGVTGLWQLCRTRKPGRDFQEWIYYDVKYVRELTLKQDLWICWRTAKKMAAKFINQF